MNQDTCTELFQSIMNFSRTKHADLIDKAYEYFWEEEDPEDFLGGTALSLGFINFEDWFICDYRTEDDKSIIDLYREASEGLGEDELKALDAMKDSTLSIYEVLSTGDRTNLKDVILDDEFTSSGEALKSLTEGDLFASRFLSLGGERVMSRCVYPFSTGAKEIVLENFNIALNRYLKNEESGTVRDFIKKYSYTFNVLWLDNIFRSRRKN
jgi:hypothetical protein